MYNNCLREGGVSVPPKSTTFFYVATNEIWLEDDGDVTDDDGFPDLDDAIQGKDNWLSLGAWMCNFPPF